jgi:hypothetical protein
MSLAAAAGRHAQTEATAIEEYIVPATYTFDVFSSLDGYGSAGGDWGGYWGKQGPELLDHRLALHTPDQRMVFGANTYRLFAGFLASSSENSEVGDPWQSGRSPLFDGAADFDLELIENRTLDANIPELTYRPTLHVP